MQNHVNNTRKDRIMKVRMKKHACLQQKKKIEFSKTWIHLLRITLCICLAFIICSSCALFEIVFLRCKTQSLMNSSDLEADRIRIYIDQGHNPAPYHNNGAEGNGLYEQDLTFNIGCLLAELLSEDGRFEVCLSRPKENTVLGTDIVSSLQARVDGAIAFEADYFISLHINAYTQDSVNGIEVFTSGRNSESYAFGNSILLGMIDSTNLKNRGMKQGADLYVLKNTEIPAALLEMGFISNSADAALLSEQPELFAQGIYDGIIDYIESAYTRDINILLFIIGISIVVAAILIVLDLMIAKKYNYIKEEKWKTKKI